MLAVRIEGQHVSKPQSLRFPHAKQHRRALAAIPRQHPDSKIRLRFRHFGEPVLRMIGAAVDDNPNRRPFLESGAHG